MDNNKNKPPGTFEDRQPTPKRRTGQTLICGWCGTDMTVKTRGRTPKWCSSACRHRAWEQSRASSSGQAAVRIVDRRVVLERAVPVIEHHRVEVLPHDGPGWADALDELAEQIASPFGRIGDRDLGTLMRALQHAARVIDQRPGWRNGHWH